MYFKGRFKTLRLQEHFTMKRSSESLTLKEIKKQLEHGNVKTGHAERNTHKTSGGSSVLSLPSSASAACTGN